MKLKRLKDLREDSDWTQQQLADRLSISRSAYSAYENGANAPPIEVLLRLAEIYNTSVDYILGRTDVRLPYPPSKYRDL
mgnify:CR=1 FL=1